MTEKFSAYLVTGPTEHVYVGITSKPIHKRLAVHFSNVNLGKNPNSKLYMAVRKHGAASFSIRVLATFETWAEACAAEQELISKYNSYENGYNATRGGEGTHGYIPGPETRAKMSASLKGIKRTDEWKRKIGDGNRGRVFPPVTDDARAKMRAFQKGRTKSEEHKQKIRESVAASWVLRKYNNSIKA